MSKARDDAPLVSGPALDYPEFDVLSKWYDFDYERRIRKDLPFYVSCAEEGGGPVLELGAGTGRVTARLAKAGFDVTAVDLSPQMLALARRRFERIRGATGRVKFVEADMANLDVRGRFGTVIVPFRSFNHLYTVDRQLAALRAIRARLKPDGLGVIDLWNADLAEMSEIADKVQLSYERKHPQRGTKVVQRFVMRPDYPRQIAYLEYIWDEYKGSRRVNRDRAPMRARWFHRYEFEHLLARAGLRVVRLYGDFDRREYRHDSEDLIFLVARD